MEFFLIYTRNIKIFTCPAAWSIRKYEQTSAIFKACIVVFFLPWSSEGVAYANFISDLLSEVFVVYTELIRLFEMECLI